MARTVRCAARLATMDGCELAAPPASPSQSGAPRGTARPARPRGRRSHSLTRLMKPSQSSATPPSPRAAPGPSTLAPGSVLRLLGVGQLRRVVTASVRCAARRSTPGSYAQQPHKI